VIESAPMMTPFFFADALTVAPTTMPHLRTLSLLVIITLLCTISVNGWNSSSLLKITVCNVGNAARPLVTAAFLLANVSNASPNIQQGAKIFDSTCASCHPNGQNKIAKEKTLQKHDLEEYVGLDPSDIQQYMRADFLHRGANLFGGDLSNRDLENVVAFVLEQAVENKW